MKIIGYAKEMLITVGAYIYGAVVTVALFKVMNFVLVYKGPWWVVAYVIGLIIFMFVDLMRKKMFEFKHKHFIILTIINLLILCMYYTSDKYGL